jgi:hypothetical protein
MNPTSRKKHSKFLQQAGLLLKPRNLLKTVARQIPGASIATDLMDQIEGCEADERLANLETEIESHIAFETSRKPSPLLDWSSTVGDYLPRTVDIALVTDAGPHSPRRQGGGLIQSVAHACITGDKEITTCIEALELARDVAEDKGGRLIVVVGHAWYDFTADPAEQASGLCTCRLTSRDEQHWREAQALWRKHMLSDLQDPLITTPVKYALSTGMGQEVGFLHSGEAENVLRSANAFSKRQFDTSVISHFRKPTATALRTFVTGVLPGRVLHAGAPVFSRDGSLLGILSDTESYRSDAGRRAVVRTLLGHPRFTKPHKKDAK